MTKDELKEFAASEDGSAIMAEFLQEAGYRSTESVQGLENKKNELLGKLKKASDKNKAIDQLFQEYDIVDAEDLSSKLATLAGAKEKESDLEKLQRRLEIIEKTASEADKKAAEERARRVSSEKRAGIVSALKNAHVDDVSFDMLIPYFDGLVTAEEDEAGKVSLFVDSDTGQSPLNSFVDEWSKTDKAKQFIKAPSNSGGGSGGPGTGGSGKQRTLEDISKIADRDERLKALKELGVSM